MLVYDDGGSEMIRRLSYDNYEALNEAMLHELLDGDADNGSDENQNSNRTPDASSENDSCESAELT